jgi:cell division protease FtsH
LIALMHERRAIMNKNFLKNASVWMFIILAFFVATTWYGSGSAKKTEIPYSELITKIQAGEVKEITIESENADATGKYSNNETFTVNVADVSNFEKYITDYNNKNTGNIIKTDFNPPTRIPMWVTVIPNILMILMLVAVWFIFMQQSQGGGGGKGVMNFGKSRAKLVPNDKKKVNFDDVAGADEEKGELAEIVDFLKQPRRYIELGARIPKGILLVGPPGTGKTLLAKAVSGEAGVPFFSISGSDFVEMFVGVGASRVRDLFENAKKNAPCIIFIDEIDAVGRHRGAGMGGGHDEREQTLNQLLVEMDGFGTNEGIILVAATNRPDILDPALLRPGRFDRQIVVNTPDVKGREEILRVHSRNKPLEDDVDLTVLAKGTPGFTGADLENLMNEGALLSVRRDKKLIGMTELQEAITRVMMGPEKKSRVQTEKERKLTAYHEAGHAVVRRLIPDADPVHQVSIIPRGMAGGFTASLPKEDRSYMSKIELQGLIAIMLGGRVAEKLILGDISTGASSDIERATSISRKMVTQYGMSDVLGPIEYGSGHDEVFMGRDFGKTRNYSEDVAAIIDREIKGIIQEGYETAEKILRENEAKLHVVALTLLEKEKLDSDAFEKLFSEEVKETQATQATEEVNKPEI